MLVSLQSTPGWHSSAHLAIAEKYDVPNKLLYLFGLLLVTGACHEAHEAVGRGAAVAEADSGVEHTDATQGESTREPSAGATATCDAAQCAQETMAVVQSLSSPASSWRTFVGGRCELVSLVGGASGMTCNCDTGSGSIAIGPSGAGCFVYGRAGECLWNDAEYEACDPAADSCASACKRLEARFAEDARATYAVSVRHSECGVDSACHSVLRIGDRCYADRSYESGTAYDCALDDESILERHVTSQMSKPVPDCSQLDRNVGGLCTEQVSTSLDACVPRAPEEWQGLRVCPPYVPCERTEYCNLARVCVDGQCVACARDEDCLEGEGCALEHCVRKELIECRSRKDCKDNRRCVLDGYGHGMRNNDDMRAYCLRSNYER